MTRREMFETLLHEYEAAKASWIKVYTRQIEKAPVNEAGEADMEYIQKANEEFERGLQSLVAQFWREVADLIYGK